MVSKHSTVVSMQRTEVREGGGYPCLEGAVVSGTGLGGFTAVQLRLPPTPHPSAVSSLVLGFQAGNITTGLK